MGNTVLGAPGKDYQQPNQGDRLYYKNFIIHLSYRVQIVIFLLADLYHMILGCDKTAGKSR